MEENCTWMTAIKAAKYLGICRRSLKNMRDEGKIPFYPMSENKKGRKIIFYKKEEIDKIIEQHRR